MVAHRGVNPALNTLAADLPALLDGTEDGILGQDRTGTGRDDMTVTGVGTYFLLNPWVFFALAVETYRAVTFNTEQLAVVRAFFVGRITQSGSFGLTISTFGFLSCHK